MAKSDVDEFAGTGVGAGGDLGGNQGAIDPATLAGTGSGDSGTDEYVRDDAGNIKRNKDGSPRRKRGRKAGSGSGAKPSQKTALDLGVIEGILVTLHAGLASASKCPEFELATDESKNLAKSIQEVAKLYDTTVDPRVLAWGNLIGIAGMIYVPRYILIRDRLAFEKSERAKRAKDGSMDGEVVTQFPSLKN